LLEKRLPFADCRDKAEKKAGIVPGLFHFCLFLAIDRNRQPFL
jgi:hypothetical protein